MTNQRLVDLYNELQNYIEGDFFIGDGGLLGLYREGRFIDYDKDIDIYLMPNTKINIPQNCGIDITEYYMDSKVFFVDSPKPKLNKWIEYLAYSNVKLSNEGTYFDRKRLFQHAKTTYKDEGLDIKFTTPYIDIYYLEEAGDKYKIKNKSGTTCGWDKFFYYKNEVSQLSFIGGYPVPRFDTIPAILERNYGSNWEIPDPNFQHLKTVRKKIEMSKAT
tara:strand:+ start:434 stop:1087 length:654 start_codon:yes stop_codon:yes gene_type:complete